MHLREPEHRPFEHTPAARRSRVAEWKVGEQRLYLGDCLELLPRLADNVVDVVVTSPPYNLGIAYRSYEDSLPRTEYLDWMGRVAAELRRVLKADGSLFLNVGSTNADPWVAADVAETFRKHFVLQNHIIWVKSISIGDDTVGHFKPINSRRFLNHSHEAIYHFTTEGRTEVDRLAVGVPFKDKSNIARWGHVRDKRCAGDVWFIPYRTVQSKAQKFDHPAGYPVELAERCIRLHGVEKAKVLDPFAGTGTTLVAAAILGCQGLGFELDEEYARTAAARLKSL